MSCVVAVDLPWGERDAGRFAWALVQEDGLVLDLQWSRTESDFLAFLGSIEATVEVVALDIPIDGYEWMAREGRHFRPLDKALQSSGVPLYPSLGQGDRGARLAEAVQRSVNNTDCTIYEVYPYVNLCVLRAWSREEGTRRAPWGAPLRYKKGAKAERLKDLRHVRELLEKELRFDGVVLPSGSSDETVAALDRLADAYDGCLAAVPALYWLRRDDQACVIGDEEHGKMLLLAEERLLQACTRYQVPIVSGSQGDHL